MIIRNKSFKTTNGNRLAFNASYALALALIFLRTNSAANSGKARGLGNDFISFFKLALCNLGNKIGNINPYGAAADARLIFAVKAALCLLNRLLGSIAERNLFKITVSYIRLLLGHGRFAF